MKDKATIEKIALKSTAEAFGIPYANIIGQRRFPILVTCRIAIASILADLSMDQRQIGNFLNVPKSTVSYYSKRHKQKLSDSFYRIKYRMASEAFRINLIEFERSLIN